MALDVNLKKKLRLCFSGKKLKGRQFHFRKCEKKTVSVLHFTILTLNVRPICQNSSTLKFMQSGHKGKKLVKPVDLNIFVEKTKG